MSARPLRLGTRTASKISYHCDLQQESGLVIPLGVMAEVVVGSFRGLGLIARTELQQNDLEHIASMMRPSLLNPFDFLRHEFDWAWGHTKAGEALAAFANRHTASLFFSPPKTTGFTAEAAQVKSKLESFLRHQYSLLLQETLKKAEAKKVAPVTGSIAILKKAA